jgi:hypothetical protein
MSTLKIVAFPQQRLAYATDGDLTFRELLEELHEDDILSSYDRVENTIESIQPGDPAAILHDAAFVEVPVKTFDTNRGFTFSIPGHNMISVDKQSKTWELIDSSNETVDSGSFSKLSEVLETALIFVSASELFEGVYPALQLD